MYPLRVWGRILGGPWVGFPYILLKSCQGGIHSAQAVVFVIYIFWEGPWFFDNNHDYYFNLLIHSRYSDGNLFFSTSSISIQEEKYTVTSKR